jgi:hypothetical protein
MKEESQAWETREKSITSPQSGEIDLKLESVRSLKSQSRLGSILTMIGATAALGALLWSSAQIRSARSELHQIDVEKSNLSSEVQSLRDEKQKLDQQIASKEQEVQGLLTTTNGLLAHSGPGASFALKQATAANPDAAKAVPIIYLDVATEEQIPAANKIANVLRPAGFVVPKAGPPSDSRKNPETTELRYYEQSAQSSQDVSAILDKLKSMGVVAKPVIPNWTSARKPPSRQYEIWFSPSQFDEPPVTASSH